MVQLKLNGLTEKQIQTRNAFKKEEKQALMSTSLIL
jgi:hypothetical protein